MPNPALIRFPRRQVFGRQAPCAFTLELADFRFNGGGNGFADLVLYYENILKLTIVPLRPDMAATRAIDELGRDPQAIALASDTAFQNVTYAKITADRSDIG